MLKFWNNQKARGIFFQLLGLIIIFVLAFFFISNIGENLEKKGMSFGFDFLNRVSGFEISESLIAYGSEDTYARAFLVGILNTLKVAFVGNILAVFLGGIIGVARLSKNLLLAKITQGYVGLVRNVPLLLQLFFWYAVFTEILPNVRNALNPMKGVFLSNRGIMLPLIEYHPLYLFIALCVLLILVGGCFFRAYVKKVQERTGRWIPYLPITLAALCVIPLLIWLVGGMPLTFDFPKVAGFNFSGGMGLSPEFISLLLGLVIYTSAFIAEIVRSGIQSIDKGQIEAANALGLKPLSILMLIVLPQAFRSIIPPLTSQLLNLTKNSSLAVAIAYPDFVNIANTTMNQTGQSIEVILLIIGVYLCFSLITSLFMNWFNKKMSLVER
jgi:general L-amino acid transport system permease protein